MLISHLHKARVVLSKIFIGVNVYVATLEFELLVHVLLLPLESLENYLGTVKLFHYDSFSQSNLSNHFKEIKPFVISIWSSRCLRSEC